MDFFGPISILAIVAVLGITLWRYLAPRLRSRRQDNQDDCDTSGLEDRLRAAREIAAPFRPRPPVAPTTSARGHGPLAFRVPEIPEGVSDDEIRDLNGFAEAVVCAEEHAALTAQIAREAVRGGEAIVASRDRAVGHNVVTEERHGHLHEMFAPEGEPEPVATTA
ncbi:MAG: hypothetical protein Q8Q38_01415 [bacterium]|nr:hypothetical protein [bacterium]